MRFTYPIGTTMKKKIHSHARIENSCHSDTFLIALTEVASLENLKYMKVKTVPVVRSVLIVQKQKTGPIERSSITPNGKNKRI